MKHIELPENYKWKIARVNEEYSGPQIRVRLKRQWGIFWVTQNQTWIDIQNDLEELERAIVAAERKLWRGVETDRLKRAELADRDAKINEMIRSVTQ